MPEQRLSDILREEGVEYVISLPCDRTKDLCTILERDFHYININREEDGVGVCAGLALAGRRAVLQMQSSGLGNSLNALMSLTKLYALPLPIIASWRGVYKEKIAAQIPFNSRIPAMLDAMGIPYTVVSGMPEIKEIRKGIRRAYENNEIHVILITPRFWEGGGALCTAEEFPSRARAMDLRYRRDFGEPTMIRADAITAIAGVLDDELAVVNLGVPCKEMYAARDRSENFYMLGSYTQATPIGLGLAIGQERDVVVLDGDGSLLGTAILPVVADENPENLTIIALDNGAFGSTGMQQTHAWLASDLELMAIGAGIEHTVKVSEEGDLVREFESRKKGLFFIHVLLSPGNTDASNIALTPEEIKRRFMGIL